MAHFLINDNENLVNAIEHYYNTKDYMGNRMAGLIKDLQELEPIQSYFEDGILKGFIFNKVVKSKAWRRLKGVKKCYVPNMRTKEGQNIQKQLEKFKLPDMSAIAKHSGYKQSYQLMDGIITEHFPICTRLMIQGEPVHCISIADELMTSQHDYTVPEGLTEITFGELLDLRAQAYKEGFAEKAMGKTF